MQREHVKHINLRDPSAAAAHAREFWSKRYLDFNLSESGWIGAGERYNEYLYECKRQSLKRALRLIGINVKSALDVLDAGCGQGFFAEVWMKDFPKARYTGVDISEKVVAHLQPRYAGLDFFVGDLTSWKHPTRQQFDLIHAFHVFLMFVSDSAVEQAVCNLASQLKPTGHLLLTAALPKHSVDPTEYTRHPSQAFWRALLPKAALELVSIDRMYYWLPDGGPKNRVASKILRLPGPWLLYVLDRCAHSLRLPHLFGGWDSRTKLLVLRRP